MGVVRVGSKFGKLACLKIDGMSITCNSSSLQFTLIATKHAQATHLVMLLVLTQDAQNGSLFGSLHPRCIHPVRGLNIFPADTTGGGEAHLQTASNLGENEKGKQGKLPSGTAINWLPWLPASVHGMVSKLVKHVKLSHAENKSPLLQTLTS